MVTAAAKRPRTSEFGRRSHLTAAALSSVLQEVRELGMPEHFSRRTVQRDRQRIVNAETPFGPILQSLRDRTKGGKEIELHVQHPFAFMWHAASRHEAFKSHLLSAFKANNNRLSVIMYCDEINAGRTTADVKTREIQAVYWSIKEFGPSLLSNEDAWFCMMTTPSLIIEQLEGRMAHAFKLCYSYFDPLRTGVSMEFDDVAPIILHGSVSIVVQDERAHKSVFGMKGASGLKFCCLCMRYVQPRNHMLPDPSGYCIPGDSLPLDETQLHTDATIRAIVAKLQELAAAGSREEQDEVSMITGFNHVPQSVLHHDPEFALTSVLVWDFMHVYFVTGVFDTEMSELMRRLKEQKLEVGAKEFDAFSNLFTWPRAYAAGNLVCRPNALETNYEPSGTASEFLSVAPVLALYLRRVVKPLGICAAEIESMLALCDVVELLLLAMRGLCKPAMLKAGIIKHLELSKVAYSDKLWRPKTHFAMHLPAQLERHGFLPCCFVQDAARVDCLL